jgi:hypothetical protein
MSDFLERGKQYTFTFKNYTVTTENAVDVLSRTQTVSGISQVTVNRSGGIFGLGGGQFDISFTYTGDGADVVAVVAGNILSAIDSFPYYHDFVSAQEGVSGPPAKEENTPSLPKLTDVNTTLVIVVIGIGLVVFLFAGGPSLIRRATE